jgi:hypothetical protein
MIRRTAMKYGNYLGVQGVYFKALIEGGMPC